MCHTCFIKWTEYHSLCQMWAGCDVIKQESVVVLTRNKHIFSLSNSLSENDNRKYINHEYIFNIWKSSIIMQTALLIVTPQNNSAVDGVP